MAHLDYQQKLRDGVQKLTEALDQVKSKVATYRDDAREIEVENVAIVVTASCARGWPTRPEAPNRGRAETGQAGRTIRRRAGRGRG